MPVRMIGIGGLGGQRQAEQYDSGGKNIRGGLQSVCDHGGRVAHETGGDFNGSKHSTDEHPGESDALPDLHLLTVYEKRSWPEEENDLDFRTQRWIDCNSRVANRQTAGVGHFEEESDRMLGTVLIIIVVLLLIGALPTWPYSNGWGYYPSGGLGLILLVVLLLLLLGRI